MFYRYGGSYEKTIRQLQRRQAIAKIKYEERKLKWEIFKLHLPFLFSMKFSKGIVLLSIAAIIAYTIGAILLQKNTMMELSPTLTTCVYGFFGTELLGLAGIKIWDTKLLNDSSTPSSVEKENADG
ncbi:MAG: hypothetical protein HFI78_05405 [Lachnospiraceae bacterium]|jgi:hypothetical protein|nr:hypothetical protein [Lachnospiraceae bacterium]